MSNVSLSARLDFGAMRQSCGSQATGERPLRTVLGAHTGVWGAVIRSDATCHSGPSEGPGLLPAHPLIGLGLQVPQPRWGAQLDLGTPLKGLWCWPSRYGAPCRSPVVLSGPVGTTETLRGLPVSSADAWIWSPSRWVDCLAEK